MKTRPPEEYTLPEGVDTKLAEWAKENNLTQEQLDNSLRLFQESQTAIQESIAAENERASLDLFKTWGDEAEEKQVMAKQALAYGDPDGELAKLMTTISADKHPAVWKFMAKIGEALSEGDFVESQKHGNSKTPKTKAQRLFPNFK